MRLKGSFENKRKVPVFTEGGDIVGAIQKRTRGGVSYTFYPNKKAQELLGPDGKNPICGGDLDGLMEILERSYIEGLDVTELANDGLDQYDHAV